MRGILRAATVETHARLYRRPATTAFQCCARRASAACHKKPVVTPAFAGVYAGCMKRSVPRDRDAEIANLKDGVQFTLESLAWLAAWVLIPVWLAWRDTGFVHFLAYSAVSGCLLAAGVLADRGKAFEDLKHLFWFAGLTSLAILFFGGVTFGLTHLLL